MGADDLSLYSLRPSIRRVFVRPGGLAAGSAALREGRDPIGTGGLGRGEPPGQGSPHSMKHTLALIGGVVGACALSAANWPQFRGPTGQGLSTETRVPLTWSAKSNILWRASIPGEAWSSPVVWGRHVFLTTATESGASCRVMALDAKTGKVRWERELFRQVTRKKEGRNSYATPTPVTDGHRVYTCFGDGSFAALTFDGQVAWTNRSYPFYSQHGLGTSLALHNGLLVMARDGSSEGPDKLVGWQKPWDQSYLLALDTKAGQERWRTGRGMTRIAHGTPILWRDGASTQWVSETGDVVQGFDPGTGRLLWTSRVTGEGKVPSPVVGGGSVFTSGGWGGKGTVKAFRLGGSGDLGESNLTWEQKKGMPTLSSMLYANGRLFAVTDGGVATCYDATSGSIVWQERLGGNFSGSPVAAAGRLYFTSDAGVTTVLEAGPVFRVLAKNELGESLQASPALADGRWFIRTAGALVCVGK